MLISPAEPAPLKRLGKVSSVPEQYGADFLIGTNAFGLVGIQRKELSDLVASLNDDRFSREVIQMKELEWAIWLIEGTPQFTSDGQALWTRTKHTRAMHYGLVFNLLSQGFSVLSTTSLNESIELLSMLNQWLAKTKHSTLNSRSSARGMFGRPDLQEQQVHFLQGLPGLGYERARALVDHFQGLPLMLTGDLTEVPGIGKTTAKRIGDIFNATE